jgi:hypothetical protein
MLFLETDSLGVWVGPIRFRGWVSILVGERRFDWVSLDWILGTSANDEGEMGFIDVMRG